MTSELASEPPQHDETYRHPYINYIKLERLGRFQVGLPTGVHDIDDYANSVDLTSRGAFEITQTGVGRLGATVSQHVAPVISDVHHPDAELGPESMSVSRKRSRR